jgi:hypothetical protein
MHERANTESKGHFDWRLLSVCGPASAGISGSENVSNGPCHGHYVAGSDKFPRWIILELVSDKHTRETCKASIYNERGVELLSYTLQKTNPQSAITTTTASGGVLSSMQIWL